MSRFLKASASNVGAEDWEYGTETYAGDLTTAGDYTDRATSGTNSVTGTRLADQDTIDIEASRPNNAARQSTSKTNGGLP